MKPKQYSYKQNQKKYIPHTSITKPKCKQGTYGSERPSFNDKRILTHPFNDSLYHL